MTEFNKYYIDLMNGLICERRIRQMRGVSPIKIPNDLYNDINKWFNGCIDSFFKYCLIIELDNSKSYLTDARRENNVKEVSKFSTNIDLLDELISLFGNVNESGDLVIERSFSNMRKYFKDDYTHGDHDLLSKICNRPLVIRVNFVNKRSDVNGGLNASYNSNSATINIYIYLSERYFGSSNSVSRTLSNYFNIRNEILSSLHHELQHYIQKEVMIPLGYIKDEMYLSGRNGDDYGKYSSQYSETGPLLTSAMADLREKIFRFKEINPKFEFTLNNFKIFTCYNKVSSFKFNFMDIVPSEIFENLKSYNRVRWLKAVKKFYKMCVKEELF